MRAVEQAEVALEAVLRRRFRVIQGTVMSRKASGKLTPRSTSITLTSVVVASNVATATKTNHGYSVGDQVYVAGSNLSYANGLKTVASVPDANTFTYAATGSNATATGTITGTYGIMTAGTVTGAYNVGETVTGSGISVTTTITQQITGSPGAAGTYAVDVNTVVGSTTITSADSIETEWYCKSAGAAGDLVKIARVK